MNDEKMASRNINNHEDHFQTSSTNPTTTTPPKLSLSKLPKKPRNHDPLLLTTPPLHPSVSVPFQWEEAPGKPKFNTKSSKAIRCLDLPPRLTSEAGKITNTPSPTTVLDGPYVGRSFSCVNEASAFEKKEETIDHDKNNNKDMLMMRRRMRRSWRWENLKENNNNNNNNRGVVVKGNFDFSSGPLSSTSVLSRDNDACDFDTNQSKFLRFTRKGSFFNNSNLLGGIYESFKQAVPWRWRRTKTKRVI